MKLKSFLAIIFITVAHTMPVFSDFSSGEISQLKDIFSCKNLELLKFNLVSDDYDASSDESKTDVETVESVSEQGKFC